MSEAFIEHCLDRLVLIGACRGEQLEPKDAIIGVTRGEIAVPVKIIFRPGPRERPAVRGESGGRFHQRRLNGQGFRRLGKRAAELKDADGELFRLVSELICLV